VDPEGVVRTLPAIRDAARGGDRRAATSRSSATVAVALLLALFVPPAGLPAGDEGGSWPAGAEVARRINTRDDGEHVTRRIVMELIDRRGKRRVRETVGYRRYYGDEKRTVLFYEKPKNVAGTGFLTFDYQDPDREDDQWLYLPALRKVRRISASDRGDYFLGTDFTYEDMKKEGKVSLEDYRFRTIGVEEVGGHRCYLVECTPMSDAIAKELGYGRVVLYTDPEIWMPRKSEFWDPKGRRLKTIHATEITKVNGIWTAHRIEAENHKTGHRTIFRSTEVSYSSPVKDDVFTERALRRGP
jgi:outer membrane lipoprotein-sorting protein